MNAQSPFHCGGPSGPLFGFLHRAGADVHSTGVLLCGPFGWDAVCAHRPLREWAERLAGAGFATLRFDLPGAGDSAGSPRDPELLDAWVESVAAAAERLLSEDGVDEVTAVGIGLGGMLAWLATARGARVGDLVLWGVPSRGRALVRELQALTAFERAEYSRTVDEPEPAPEEGVLVAAGYVLTDVTAAELRSLDLAKIDVASGRRLLLLGRDGMEADARLRDHAVALGLDAATGPGDGYGAMTAEPQLAAAPVATFDRVAAWLEQRRAPTPATKRRGHLSAAGDNDVGGVRERSLTIPFDFGDGFGILSEPVGEQPTGLTLVLLNAGAQRHIGPNRMWTEAARRWSRRGVRALRLDLEAIGDADGDASRFHDVGELYVPRYVAQVRTALDLLPPSRFVLAGLCAGAYWALHAAREDARVQAAVLINPRALVWDPVIEEHRRARFAGARVGRRSSWERVLRGQVPPRDVARAAGALVRAKLDRRTGKLPREDELRAVLDDLTREDCRLVLAFSGGEPLHEELAATGLLADLAGRPNVTLESLPGSHHTLRPLHAQRAGHALLDRVLETELARAGDSRGMR